VIFIHLSFCVKLFRMSKEKGKGLLNARAMDGPVIKNTVADVFKSNPKVAVTYHVMSTPFSLFNTAGVLLGGGLYGAGFRPLPSALAMMGTTGVVAGSLGMVLGLAAMSGIAAKGEAASPPWNQDGIQQRVDGLSHNFKVRVLDLSAWSGMAVAAGALLFAGGPSKLKLSAGPLGVLQALSLGTALGSFGAFGCMYSNRPSEEDDE
jgi:hypothetical protein